jgi:hypothetical protein
MIMKGSHLRQTAIHHRDVLTNSQGIQSVEKWMTSQNVLQYFYSNKSRRKIGI